MDIKSKLFDEIGKKRSIHIDLNENNEENCKRNLYEWISLNQSLMKKFDLHLKQLCESLNLNYNNFIIIGSRNIEVAASHPKSNINIFFCIDNEIQPKKDNDNEIISSDTDEDSSNDTEIDDNWKYDNFIHEKFHGRFDLIQTKIINLISNYYEKNFLNCEIKTKYQNDEVISNNFININDLFIDLNTDEKFPKIVYGFGNRKEAMDLLNSQKMYFSKKTIIEKYNIINSKYGYSLIIEKEKKHFHKYKYAKLEKLFINNQFLNFIKKTKN